ncbi:MAG: cation-translocating P-type ATPase [Kiritimatiellales bacterium]
MKHQKKETCGACCSTKTPAADSEKNTMLRDGIILIIALVSLVLSFLISHFHIHVPFFPLITDPSWFSVIFCGWPIARSAWRAAKARRITSPMLITLAMFASIALQVMTMFNESLGGHAHSYIFAAGEIAFLMALGELIEARTLSKTRAGVRSLITLTPKQALKKNGAEFESVNVDSLQIGDIVLVRPNDMIPVDGEIIEGGGAVDQSSMTGESVPAEKNTGDTVLAGTWNKSGSMIVRVQKKSGDTAIARLIQLVEEANSKKAPVVRIANKWAAAIVPSAIIISVLVFFFAWLALGVPALDAVIRGVTILVVFCPCAFGLATPTAIAAGIGNASHRGIMIKSGAALEEMSHIDTVVFDKTGTLTAARLTVKAVKAFGMDDDELLKLCAGAELYSEHPIAKAILGYAKERIEIPVPEDTKSLAGIGIECTVNGIHVLVCSFDALQKSGTDYSAGAAFAAERLEQGETLVCAVAAGKFAGIISLSDTIKPGAAGAVETLKRAGCKTVMLTGDNERAAHRVAAAVGIDDFYHSLLPADKAAKVEALRDSGARICMLGDGVNDAPALALANCSVAMGALGSDLAVETADIAFLNDNVSLISGLVKFSRVVMFKIRANMALSLTISFAAIILSAFGILDPVSGALLHNLSSVTVVLNSAALLPRTKEYK